MPPEISFLLPLPFIELGGKGLDKRSKRETGMRAAWTIVV